MRGILPFLVTVPGFQYPLVSWGLWIFWRGSPEGPVSIQAGGGSGPFGCDQVSAGQACCLKWPPHPSEGPILRVREAGCGCLLRDRSALLGKATQASLRSCPNPVRLSDFATGLSFPPGTAKAALRFECQMPARLGRGLRLCLH